MLGKNPLLHVWLYPQPVGRDPEGHVAMYQVFVRVEAAFRSVCLCLCMCLCLRLRLWLWLHLCVSRRVGERGSDVAVGRALEHLLAHVCDVLQLRAWACV